MSSKIEWTEKTWNPVVGCTKVSPGCKNCYAERMAGRLANMGQKKYQQVVEYEEDIWSGENCVNKTEVSFYGEWNGHIYRDESVLDKPLHWKKPRMIFVCSMGDLFHESVPFEFIDKVLGVMHKARQHTYQILTKRHEQMYQYFMYNNTQRHCYLRGGNIWLGVTVEHPDYKFRADILRRIPAAVRFLSIEPCLADMGELNLEGIDWVIVGGESGPRARPMHPDWARGVRDQCVAAGVPFFFKQWGKYAPVNDGVRAGDICMTPDGNYEIAPKNYICFANESEGVHMRPLGKKRAGRLLDGIKWSEYPKGGK
jgi:protein gp37